MSTLHIVGGGLAGMTVAWEMAQAKKAGFDRFDEIVLYEASHRLGGKAGSEATIDSYDENADRTPSDDADKWSDHGYHLFPVWYRNVIGLMGEIGVDYDRIVVEGEKFAHIPRTLAVNRLSSTNDGRPALTKTPLTRLKEYVGDKAPGLEVVDNMPSATLIAGKKAPVLPLILMFCTLPWLISESDRALKRLSIEDFLKTRFRFVHSLALPSYQGLVLKALTADTRTMSAYALAKMFRRWTCPMRYLAGASWSSLNGSLQMSFIEPFEHALTAAGVDVIKGRVLSGLETKNGAVVSLHFEVGGSIPIDDGDHVVSAVPPNVLADVSSDQLEAAAKRLANEMSTFSGVDIYFPNPMTVPRQHFGFVVEPKDFGATAYDIRPVWPEDQLSYSYPLVLQVVIPQTERIAQKGKISEEALIRHVREKVGDTFGFESTKWFVHVNDTSRLSLATLDAYQARDALPRINGLSLAGDFMDSSIEVPSMEGAVGNGRRVAAELTGKERDTGDPDVPHSLSWRTITITLLALLGWILAYAIAIVASLYLIPRGIYRWFRRRSRGDASEPR